MGAKEGKIHYSCIILAQIITISNNDITITNKICMGSALGHIKRGKIITISNISLYPISLYPLCTVLVEKKDGTMRLAVDYRSLNNETKRDSYPLPEARDILDKLHGSKYCSFLDGA